MLNENNALRFTAKKKSGERMYLVMGLVSSDSMFVLVLHKQLTKHKSNTMLVNKLIVIEQAESFEPLPLVWIIIYYETAFSTAVKGGS